MALSLSLGVPAYFQRQLGGQTGDSYGAIVEWTETLLLVALCIVEQIESLA
ncbi:MAG: adenosylcobinamide-GDP ribazoletransferase [Prochlorotrichaceae cyanobacterium]